jgi:hypothetical protein
MASETVSDRSWTTGNDPHLVHSRIIDVGATGEVHEVLFLFLAFFLPFSSKEIMEK